MMKPDHISPGKKRILFGVGGYAAGLINALDPHTLEGLDFLAMDRYDAFPPDWDPAYLIPMKSINPHIGRSDSVLSARDAEDALSQNMGLFDSTSFVFLIAALGGACASGAAPIVLKHLKRSGIPSFAFLTMPSQEIEGRKKWMIANHALNDIRNFCTNFLIVPAHSENESMISTYQEDSTQSNLFKLQFLLDLLRLPALVPCDVSWFGSWNAHAERTGLIIAEGTGSDRAADATCRILADHEIKPFIKRPCTILMQFMTSVDLTLKDLDEATGILRKSWQNDIEIHYSVINHDTLHTSSMRLGVIVGDSSGSTVNRTHESTVKPPVLIDPIQQAGQSPSF